jgi:hypothetical protein
MIQYIDLFSHRTVRLPSVVLSHQHEAAVCRPAPACRRTVTAIKCKSMALPRACCTGCPWKVLPSWKASHSQSDSHAKQKRLTVFLHNDACDNVFKRLVEATQLLYAVFQACGCPLANLRLPERYTSKSSRFPGCT